jgi:hypothetical protein
VAGPAQVTAVTSAIGWPPSTSANQGFTSPSLQELGTDAASKLGTAVDVLKRVDPVHAAVPGAERQAVDVPDRQRLPNPAHIITGARRLESR